MQDWFDMFSIISVSHTRHATLPSKLISAWGDSAAMSLLIKGKSALRMKRLVDRTMVPITNWHLIVDHYGSAGGDEQAIGFIDANFDFPGMYVGHIPVAAGTQLRLPPPWSYRCLRENYTQDDMVKVINSLHSTQFWPEVISFCRCTGTPLRMDGGE